MTPLVFQSIQMILSLKNTGDNQHIPQDTEIANLGGRRLFYLMTPREGT